MKRFLGFTLSEIMVAITVLGIITAAVLPAILGNSPNQHKVMMKRAYLTTTHLVKEMLNNPDWYPLVGRDGQTRYHGFDNLETIASMDGLEPNRPNMGSFSSHISGNTKFFYLFNELVNGRGHQIYGSVTSGKRDAWRTGLCTYFGYDKNSDKSVDEQCFGEGGTMYKQNYRVSDFSTHSCDSIADNIANGTCFFLTTKDGMFWSFTIDPQPGANGLTSRILVDVNGEKKPNCYQGSNVENCADRTDYDQFRMEVYNDGKVQLYPDDKWAIEAISVNTSLTD